MYDKGQPYDIPPGVDTLKHHALMLFAVIFSVASPSTVIVHDAPSLLWHDAGRSPYPATENVPDELQYGFDPVVNVTLVLDGDADGESLGAAEGCPLGACDGISEGLFDGLFDGLALGEMLGEVEGEALGDSEGLADGDMLGLSLGLAVRLEHVKLFPVCKDVELDAGHPEHQSPAGQFLIFAPPHV